MQNNFELKKQIFNHQSLLTMVYEMYTYQTNLNVVNNQYHIFNSNVFALEFIVFIGMNHYLFYKFNELYSRLFNCFINVKDYQYYHMNIAMYNTFSINNDPLAVIKIG